MNTYACVSSAILASTVNEVERELEGLNLGYAMYEGQARIS